MKSFLVLLSDKQPHLLNEALLQEHIGYLKKLRKEGFLPICGSMSNNQNGMLVIRATSEKHVDELIRKDPFIKNNYYKNFVTHEFTESDDENNWLIDSSQTKNNKKNSFIDFNQKGYEKNKPITMSILFRKLKDGKTYKDFHQAWLPPVDDVSRYFSMPVLVINAQSVNDPSEIISVGLVWADVQEAVEEYKQYEKTEDIRHERIEKITDESAETRFCKIVNIDILGS